jgi:GNAT superfamily N-acetyltransferase
VKARSLIELRDAYDQHVRRNTSPDASGAIVESGPHYVRWAASDGLGWSEVAWTLLNEENVEGGIKEHVRFYRERDQSFVWRVYDYDHPPDLGGRLRHAEFTLLGHAAVMIAETASLLVPILLPEGLEAVQVTDEAGVDLLIATHEALFGHEHQDLRRSLVARLRSASQETEMFVVMAGDAAISAARIEFLPHREFSALWGGGTVAEWRGRGIYRALVSIRAQRAHARGYKFLSVLASEQSRPILERLGFNTVSKVSTYSWKP